MSMGTWAVRAGPPLLECITRVRIGVVNAMLQTASAALRLLCDVFRVAGRSWCCEAVYMMRSLSCVARSHSRAPVTHRVIATTTTCSPLRLSGRSGPEGCRRLWV